MSKGTHTLTLYRHQYADRLRKGDRIVAVDGQALPAPVQLAGRLTDGRAPLVKPRASVVEWFFYPDTHGGHTLTVERDTPRVQTRIVDGVRLTHNGPNGGWVTSDGRFEAFHQQFETECTEEHPVRGSRGMSGYLCPGWQMHHYYRWSIWERDAANLRGDYAPAGSPGAFDTFGEAAEYLAAHVNGRSPRE